MGCFTIGTNELGELLPEHPRVTPDRESHLDGEQWDEVAESKDHLFVAYTARFGEHALALAGGRLVPAFANPACDDREAKHEEHKRDDNRVLR